MLPEDEGLLERDSQVAALEGLALAAAGGSGAVVAITGGPGEGKTALADAMCALGPRTGLDVLRARGRDLERGFAFGVVRQLLEPSLGRLAPAERTRLLRGAAGLGAGALGLLPGRAVNGTFAALHGLHWLLAGLAARHPLMLALDDAHWTDEASLEWLAYLPGRIDELPVLVMLATRAGDHDATGDALTTLLAEPSVEHVTVGPLSERSIARLIERTLGRPPHPAFTAACAEATAGNPLAARELLRELALREVVPSDAESAGLGDHAPEGLQRNLLGRLVPLGGDAVATARAVAVLGEQAELRELATVAGIGIGRTGAAIDLLIEAGILAGSRPPPDESAFRGAAFAHPLLRASVYDALPARRRARMHGQAADLLRERYADPETIAVQLLLADPSGHPQRVESLRAAASGASRRGAPATAARYLRRALAEPPRASESARVLSELGRAEIVIRDRGAAEHLTAAIAATEDRVARAWLMTDLAQTVFWTGDWNEGMRLFRAAIDELGADHPDLSLRLEGNRLPFLLAFASRAGRAEIDGDLARLLLGAQEERESVRALQLSLALLLALRLRPPAEVRTLVVRGLDHGRFLAEESSDALPVTHAVIALVLAEDLDDAVTLASAIVADGSKRGSVFGFCTGSGNRALAHLHSGALAEAEADAISALELAQQHGLEFTEPFLVSYAALALAWQGRVADAERLFDGIVLPPQLLATAAGSTLLDARGRVRRLCGDRAGAIDDLRRCGETADALVFRHPAIYPWRSELALTIAATDEVEARALVARELADARESQSARAIGVALRASAAVGPQAERETLLSQSVIALERSPSRLELAHSLVALGGELRRHGQRLCARDPLRRGLELARRCHAAPLAARAHDELLAAGARPRRAFVTGVEALTPSEHRVARLVASGNSNQETAEALFITTKTVKDHLTSTYRKLGITSRAGLGPALLEGSPGVLDAREAAG